MEVSAEKFCSDFIRQNHSMPSPSSQAEMAVLRSIDASASDLMFVLVTNLLHRRLVGSWAIGRDHLWRSVALQYILHEWKPCVLVPRFGDEALEDLALVVDGAPEVDHLVVELHVHLVEMPASVPEPAHRAHPVPTDVAGEHQAEPVPPVTHRLVMGWTPPGGIHVAMLVVVHHKRRRP